MDLVFPIPELNDIKELRPYMLLKSKLESSYNIYNTTKHKIFSIKSVSSRSSFTSSLLTPEHFITIFTRVTTISRFTIDYSYAIQCRINPHHLRGMSHRAWASGWDREKP